MVETPLICFIIFYGRGPIIRGRSNGLAAKHLGGILEDSGEVLNCKYFTLAKYCTEK